MCGGVEIERRVRRRGTYLFATVFGSFNISPVTQPTSTRVHEYDGVSWFTP